MVGIVFIQIYNHCSVGYNGSCIQRVKNIFSGIIVNPGELYGSGTVEGIDCAAIGSRAVKDARGSHTDYTAGVGVDRTAFNCRAVRERGGRDGKRGVPGIDDTTSPID